MEPTPEEIRVALDSVVASPQFANAERLRRFLTHVVERAIDGRADELKEFTVASAVFDRDAAYDPRLDAVVRVEAGRLRTRLAEYYAEGGAADPVVIRVPKGGYAPSFERRLNGAPATPPADVSALAEMPHVTNPVPDAGWPASPTLPVSTATTRRHWPLAAGGVVLALALAMVFVWTSGWNTPGAPAVGLAVLPLDGDAGFEVTRSLSRALVTSASVEVVAHSRVQEAMARGETVGQMATAFGVDYTIEGRVAPAGDTWLIEVVLVDARRARKVWVDSFTGPVAAREALVGETAAAIGRAVAAHRAGR